MKINIEKSEEGKTIGEIKCNEFHWKGEIENADPDLAPYELLTKYWNWVEENRDKNE